MSERNTAIVAAIGRGVSLRTVCAIYDIDAITVRRTVEAAGQAMPVDLPGPDVLIAPRESEMLRRALNGEDFSVISRGHGVSREWVRLVVKKHTGLSAKDLKAARDSARMQFKVQRVRDHASENLDLPLDELAVHSGLSVRETEEVLGPAEAARRRRGRNVTATTEPGQVLEDLRRVAALPGGRPLSGPFYDKHRGEGLTSARLVQIFGTWSKACEAAGVEASSAVRANYTQGWSREDCLRWVLEYVRVTENPTFDGYGVWARGQDGAPSSGTVRLRCGKWIATVRDAYALEAGDLLGPIERLGGDQSNAAGSPTAPTSTEDPAQRDGLAPGEEPVYSLDPSGQGRQFDLEVRLKVEMAAHERLMDHYRSRGWVVKDTHSGSPYDALATKGTATLYLEAKGTQSAGTSVLVTRGEVEHARAHPGQCFVGIWSGIDIDESGAVRTDSGEFRVLPFVPDSGGLTVVGYEWRPE